MLFFTSEISVALWHKIMNGSSVKGVTCERRNEGRVSDDVRCLQLFPHHRHRGLQPAQHSEPAHSVTQPLTPVTRLCSTSFVHIGQSTAVDIPLAIPFFKQGLPRNKMNNKWSYTHDHLILIDKELQKERLYGQLTPVLECAPLATAPSCHQVAAPDGVPWTLHRSPPSAPPSRGWGPSLQPCAGWRVGRRLLVLWFSRFKVIIRIQIWYISDINDLE